MTWIWKHIICRMSYESQSGLRSFIWRPINNWLKTWTSFTAGLKSKSLVWHPTPTLTISQHSHQHPPSLPPSCTVSQPVLNICEDDLSKVFRRQKIRKAKGPDGVVPAYIKACAVQLSFIFTLIFNRWLELCEVPSCFKRSIIIPVPKNQKSQDWMTTDLLLQRLWWWSNLKGLCWPTWRTLLESCWTPAVFLQSKQVCGWCSQHGIALHPPTSGQTRDLCKDPVCRLQLRFQHHLHPSESTNSALCTHLHLSVDHQLPGRQAAAIVRLGELPSNTRTGLLRAAFSSHCSSPCTQMTAP